MKSFRVNKFRLLSVFIKGLVIILFLNSLLSLFMFLAGAYNTFMYSFQQFSLDFAIVLSSFSFGLEATRLMFFYLLMKRKIKYYIILVSSFLVCFIAFFIKGFLSVGF
ncbi:MULTISPECIES: hypothetical protein [unclassified Borrelia]|uniref:hypothetical protein n=1 Tax=unclassified Borrelia TaxID=2649934 RepID=UPI001E3F09DD|nr:MULTISPECIES: hypothetical protein [unclassified Borrelia]UGQ16361.1 hypothetical protein LSO06_03660 [Borrelia sp. RT5S]UGQ17481.1 hypothetical protein LSO05_03655 [Borrelia sp. RT1S]